MRGSQSAGGRFTFTKQGKSGMRVMADSIRSETPRPKSPHMNNEEPIELAHFPDAKKPKPGQQPKIERDDFPAPPYPYTDPGKKINSKFASTPRTHVNIIYCLFIHLFAFYCLHIKLN